MFRGEIVIFCKLFIKRKDWWGFRDELCNAYVIICVFDSRSTFSRELIITGAFHRDVVKNYKNKFINRQQQLLYDMYIPDRPLLNNFHGRLSSNDLFFFPRRRRYIGDKFFLHTYSDNYNISIAPTMHI